MCAAPTAVLTVAQFCRKQNSNQTIFTPCIQREAFKSLLFRPIVIRLRGCHLTPSKIPIIEKTSWTLGNLKMSMSTIKGARDDDDAPF